MLHFVYLFVQLYGTDLIPHFSGVLIYIPFILTQQIKMWGSNGNNTYESEQSTIREKENSNIRKGEEVSYTYRP